MMKRGFFAILFCLLAASGLQAEGLHVLDPACIPGPNLLDNVPARISGNMSRNGDIWECRGSDKSTVNYVCWDVVLDQKEPETLVFCGSTKFSGEKVSYICSDYSLCFDAECQDGTMIWGVNAPFEGYRSLGGEEWETALKCYVPAKPIKVLHFYCMLRWRIGDADFTMPELHQIRESDGRVFSFDGTCILGESAADCKGGNVASVSPGFYVRDAVAGSDWVRIPSGKASAEEFSLSVKSSRKKNGTVSDALKIRSLSKEDRCVTLVVAYPIGTSMTKAFDILDKVEEIGGEEVCHALGNSAGMKRLNRLPVFGVGNDGGENWIGIDPAYPAFYRTFYSPATGELCMAFDLGFIREKPEWELRICRFAMESGGGMRAAWKRYADTYPEAFAVRTPLFGLWVPNARISRVENFRDFGITYKSGTVETSFDDANGIMDFRYTEPLTWWMPMEIPSGLAGKGSLVTDGDGVSLGSDGDNELVVRYGAEEALRLAAKGDERAKTWEKSVMRDVNGNPVGKYLEPPWCNGIVWSMSELPGIAVKEGNAASSYGCKRDAIFYNDLNPVREKAAEPLPCRWMDGQYTDSVEGYVTVDLDYSREHMACVRTPLSFSLENGRPAVFKGLTVFEYLRGIERDTHDAGRLMMANATPDRYSWLAPLLDVMGQETNWRWTGDWHPLEIEELQYRRMMCYGKPYCFLQNTDFSKFSREMVEKYMMRCVAFGIFPGFFSADAYTGMYFENPDLYNRDRGLFIKYIPICRTLAELGWEPVTGVSLSDSRLLVERFGNPAEDDGLCYITVFNPTGETISYEISRMEKALSGSIRFVTGGKELDPESVAVFRIKTDNYE